MLKILLRRFINSICPIDATAWLLSIFKLDFLSFNFLHPSAIAPELTIMIFFFCLINSFISKANADNHFLLI